MCEGGGREKGEENQSGRAFMKLVGGVTINNCMRGWELFANLVKPISNGQVLLS